jgi:hypothetical protein
MRYQIADGWISGKLRGGSEDSVLTVLRELLPPGRTLQYEIVREGGAKIRALSSLDSEDLGVCPEGTFVSVVEKRLMTSLGEESVRLRISEPPQYRGWITERAHIAILVEDADSLAAAAAESADPEVSSEILRRSQVRAHRALLTGKHSKKVCEKLVTLTGSLDVSTETFFLLNGALKKAGVSISPDFTRVCYNNQGGRSMALGSRGFTRGVHYWEVRLGLAYVHVAHIWDIPEDIAA